MFAEKKKNSSEFSKLPNHIGGSTKIKGDITSQEDFRIDGHFEGNLTTTGKVVLGEKGSLDGNIKCGNAEVLGKISGDLIVDNLLSIKSSATIEGNVTAGKLAIEPGAVFNATCQMKGAQMVKNAQAKK
jgi:cytoskeletal protein CcmA (bactofilin family)